MKTNTTLNGHPIVLVIGVDPGPTPGVFGLSVAGGRVDYTDVAQVSHDLISPLLSMLVQVTPYSELLIATEKFVAGHRASRSSSAGAGAITRDMVGLVAGAARELGAVSVQRTASQVKAWATDERLARAGLEVPSGMRHAKDAARHALYAACHAGHLPDPMSSRYKKPTTKRST